jgi:hypothetical protein
VIVSGPDALALRMRAQGLAGSPAGDVAGAVRRAAGLQAQDTVAARLAVRARSGGLDEAAVVRAGNTDRTVVRSWLMRGTLHMVPSEDLRWLTALLGPSVLSGGRRRRDQLGLTDAVCARAMAELPEVLAAGPLSRADLVARLIERGVAIDPAGQAPAHLVVYAAASGLICRGPDLDGEPAYALVDDWLGAVPAKQPAEPMGELARRYLAAFGPAGAADFAHWAGIGLGPARRAIMSIAGELVEVTLDGEPAWVTSLSTVDGTGPAVRLLPAFDTYLLGYRSRATYLAERYARRIYAGGGWLHPAVVVDGRVAGTWRQERRTDGLVVTVETFGRQPRGFAEVLAREVADLGRFQGSTARLVRGTVE